MSNFGSSLFFKKEVLMVGYKFHLAVLLVTFGLFFICVQAQACTSFVVGDRDHQLFGKNYDFGFATVMSW